jgi:hypothetical protein
MPAGNENAAIQRAAQRHAEEILALNRKAALATHQLHPTGGELIGGGSDGFKAVAAKFQAVLSTLP